MKQYTPLHSTIFGLISTTIITFASNAMAEVGLELKTLIPTLVASPGICELDVGEATCNMETTLIWEVPKAGHYCLKEAESESLLRCWENSWSGTYQVNFGSSTSRTFLLTRGPKGTIAANTVVTVTGTIEQRMRSRRRRGLWSLF